MGIISIISLVISIISLVEVFACIIMAFMIILTIEEWTDTIITNVLALILSLIVQFFILKCLWWVTGDLGEWQPFVALTSMLILQWLINESIDSGLLYEILSKLV